MVSWLDLAKPVLDKPFVVTKPVVGGRYRRVSMSKVFTISKIVLGSLVVFLSGLMPVVSFAQSAQIYNAAPRTSFDILIKVTPEESGFLSDIATQLDSLLPTKEQKVSFVNDFLSSLTDVARESTALHAFVVENFDLETHKILRLEDSRCCLSLLNA